MMRRVDDLVSDEAALWFARNRTLMGRAPEVANRIDELARSGIAGVTVSAGGADGLPNGLIDRVLPFLGRRASP
jgi:5,10-methylenetetrahydromethanopterin reductase